ncbi:MAG TPA: response regulator, partial [Corynebacterium pollutisoli]|nr:response regulator [Corynebacterium pollutisoli]
SADGDVLALALCDHRMPGTTGVEFLVDMMDDDRTAATRKVLVTGQAQLEDTIVAVNEADLDHYIAKPWDRADLEATVRDQLTSYVADMGIDPLPHLAALDQARAMDLIR